MMGAQQGKELGGGQGGAPGGSRMMVPGGGGQMSPHPHHAALPPMAGRMGERQGEQASDWLILSPFTILTSDWLITTHY